jgi:hypothetical protein
MRSEHGFRTRVVCPYAGSALTNPLTTSQLLTLSRSPSSRFSDASSASVACRAESLRLLEGHFARNLAEGPKRSPVSSQRAVAGDERSVASDAHPPERNLKSGRQGRLGGKREAEFREPLGVVT